MQSVNALTFSLFYSHFRIHTFVLRKAQAIGDAADTGEISAYVVINGIRVRSSNECNWTGSGWDIVIEALVDRASFRPDGFLVIERRGHVLRVPLADLLADAAGRDGVSLQASFQAKLAAAQADQSGARLKMLDIGGRARSGLERRLEYPECDVTVLDIHSDASVDVVGDAHELGNYFAPDSFDCALCVSVFEHLLMPWKVAVEMNKVLKTGAYAMIHTHQTVGMHDLPWDFYRFSDSSWHGMFNRFTGFQVVETSMTAFMHIVPRAWTPRHEYAERSGGFEGSTVIVRKIGETALQWHSPLAEIIGSAYPLQPKGSGTGS